MEVLIIKNMTPPPVNQEGVDLTKIIEWLIAAVTFIAAFWKLIDSHFANKRRDKQEFIEKVVRATMEISLADLKKDIAEIRGDVKTFNNTVIKIYEDIKK